MNIAYIEQVVPEAASFFELFETTGWNKKDRLASRQLHQALRSSWYMVCAYSTDQLVGFGRMISDGIMHALILDMIVHPDYQDQGIGSAILRMLKCRAEKQDIRDIQLFAAAGKAGFYRCFGFQDRPGNAPGMEIRHETKRPVCKA